MSANNDAVECVECHTGIQPGEDTSTYCGSVHQDECYSNHLKHCAICDEDGKFH